LVDDSVKHLQAKEVSQAKIASQPAEIEAGEAKERMSNILIVGMGVIIVQILFFAFFINRRLQVTRKQKQIIEAQKTEVEHQKSEADFQRLLVEEKNKEITDSINYAKRIQSAILTPD
jgi:hypothetical protein